MTTPRLAAFILTHRRPDKQRTLKALRKHGWTGPVYFIVDEADPTLAMYRAQFGERVVTFSKRDVASSFDIGDNLGDYRGVVYARNASFDIARRLGIRYFLMLDDDYTSFQHRLAPDGTYTTSYLHNLDRAFYLMLQWMIAADLDCVAMAQGGDWIGGGHKSRHTDKAPWYRQHLVNVRKVMNSFMFDAHKPMRFVGRSNEDVCSYLLHGQRGAKLFTIPSVALTQAQTQAQSGGMTELYLAQGTYVKSFYALMMAPSCTRIGALGDTHYRIHHAISYSKAVPVVIPERFRKRTPNNEQAT